MRGLERRNRGLLHPTLTPTRELFEHIERYMKYRVEVDILLYCLEEVRKDRIVGKTLSLGAGARDVLSIEQLLTLARDGSGDIRGMERFKQVAEGLEVETFLTREGEQFPAWRNPLMRGQGKNIDEFFRVLYRAELGDEAGGYLLVPEGRGAKRGFRVFPGQLLLKTVTTQPQTGFLQVARMFCHFQQQTVPSVRLMNSFPSAAIKPSKTGGTFSAWYVFSDPS